MNTMDKSKIPFLQEDTIRIQRVEIYLFDLKQRLRQLRLKHEAVIKDSVELFEELDDVSTSLLPGKTSRRKETRKSQNIRNLIQEFEKTEKLTCSSTAMETDNSKGNVEAAKNMRGILQNIERLNTSHLLQESLDLFQNAKDFFEKVDNLVGKVSSYRLNKIPENELKVNKNSVDNDAQSCPTLREKIVMFDNMSKHMQGSSYKLGLCEKKKHIKDNSDHQNNNINKSEIKSSNSNLSMKSNEENTFEENKSIASDINKESEESSEHSDEEVQSSIHYDSVPKDNCNDICFMTDRDITELSDIDVHLLEEQSIETFHTANELLSEATEGYEGDCDDSEFNLYAMKKRKAKH